MFEIAVLGPQFADRLGIVRQCMECRAAAGVNAAPCPGYGPGCLMTPRPARDDARQPEARRAVRISRDGLGVLLSAAAFGGCSAFVDVCFDVDSLES